jgi:hypothetical protein
MISAYEHGCDAARRGKHIQACPFDTGTTQWHEWRDGFMSILGYCQIHSELPVSRHVGR